MTHPTCTCPRAVHAHGTTRMYRAHNCDCEPCTTAAYKDGKTYRTNKARGTNPPRYTNARPVRDHIHTILNAGVNPKYIADHSGRAVSTIRQLRKPTTTQTTTPVATDILNVPIPATPQADRRRTDVTGTRLRLQALVAIGYSAKHLSRLLHMDWTAVQRLIDPDYYHASTWVTTKTRDRVTALYNNRWDLPATGTTPEERSAITHSRNRAARNGWVPPMGLDEERIDDPTYQPNPNHNAHRRTP